MDVARGNDGECDESEEKGTKKRQKMSKVWEHFKLDTKANTVACVHCKTALVYHNSTSSMLQHLHRRHPVYSESGGPSPETSKSSQSRIDKFIYKAPLFQSLSPEHVDMLTFLHCNKVLL